MMILPRALLIFSIVASASAHGPASTESCAPRSGGVHLLQRRTNSQRVDARNCAPLHDRESFSTVPLEVGTPATSLDVVADTGSDLVILVSCLCTTLGNCNATEPCFNGSNSSATYVQSASSPSGLTFMRVVFGSGEVTGFMATDVLTVGGSTVTMETLLMVTQTIDIDYGVLGLGLPGAASTFTDVAGLERFTVCLNDPGVDGVLDLDPPLFSTALANIGTTHWALEFRGVSVGSSSVPLDLCSTAAMTPGQETPCGAIVDSGTTMITAPAEHLVMLYESLCDEWERCRHTASHSNSQKYEVFQQILYDCDGWRSEGGVDELPSIHFQVADPNGANLTLELRPEQYIMSTWQEEIEFFRRYVFGIPVEWAHSTGEQVLVCFPAFGVEDYITPKNGPVWIFGRPFFQKYVVGFDMNASEPKISFQDGPCGTCHGDAALLAESGERIRAGGASRRTVRRIHTAPRRPRINKTLPL